MSLETRNLNKFRVSVSSEELSKWVLRLVMPLAILAWIILGLVILWATGHIFRSLLVLAVAALLAFALTPAVKVLEERVMPRIGAILIVYLVVLSGINLLLYFVVNTAASQGTAGDYKGLCWRMKEGVQLSSASGKSLQDAFLNGEPGKPIELVGLFVGHP